MDICIQTDGDSSDLLLASLTVPQGMLGRIQQGIAQQRVPSFSTLTNSSDKDSIACRLSPPRSRLVQACQSYT